MYSILSNYRFGIAYVITKLEKVLVYANLTSEHIPWMNVNYVHENKL